MNKNDNIYIKEIIKRIINTPSRMIRGFTDQYPQMYPYHPSIKNITIQVTEDCNLQCTYCYQGHKTTKSMSKELIKQIILFLFNQDESNSEFVNRDNAYAIILEFIGGEPFLEIELINYFMDCFITEGVKRNHRWCTDYMISIGTNGTLIDDPNVKKFITKYNGRLSVNVTVDGSKELHDLCRVFPDGSGSYELASKAFKETNKFSGRKGSKLTFSHENIKLLSKSVTDMIINLNMTYVQGNVVFEDVWEDEDVNIMYDQLKNVADWLLNNNREFDIGFYLLDPNYCIPMSEDNNQNWCGGNGRMLCIIPDGRIYPCLRYAPSSMGDDQRSLMIGDIDSGFLYNKEQNEDYTNLCSITRKSQSSEECFYCPIASGCSWCSAYNYQVFGTANKRTTFHCGMHKARALATSYYINSIAKKHNNPERLPMLVPKEWAVPIIGEEEYQMLLDLSMN